VTILGPVLVVAAVAARGHQSADAAADRTIPAACRTQLDARLPAWRLSPPPPALKALAAARHEVTNIVTGDFDDDGAADIALLVATTGGAAGASHLAVCLARADRSLLFLIGAPYGRDGISLTRKHTRDHDYESGRMVTYRTDGVHTYNFETSGATYLFRRGGWIRIVDSD